MHFQPRLLSTFCCCSAVSDCATPWTASPPRLLCPWDAPGENTGVGCQPSSSGSCQPRDRTQVSCIAGSCFTAEPPGKPSQLSTSIHLPFLEIYITEMYTVRCFGDWLLAYCFAALPCVSSYHPIAGFCRVIFQEECSIL